MRPVRAITLFVPIDYGSDLSLTGLSPAGISTLATACDAINERADDGDVMALNLTDVPALGMVPEDSKRWKQAYLAAHLGQPIQVVMSSAPNSIREARNIRDELSSKAIMPSKIVIICDRWHAMRLREIWPFFFPRAEFEYRTGDYVRGGDYGQIFLRHPLTWALVNVGGMLIMRSVATILGKPRMMRWIDNLRQP